MPKGRPSKGSWVKHKVEILNQRNCYIYKRPTSTVWQYYLQMDGEGQIRRSTKVEGDMDDINVGQEQAKNYAEEQYLLALSRKNTGQKAIVKKKLFDLMDDFLKEEKKRVRPYPQAGYIVEETFRQKRTHLNKLKKFYKDINQKIEKLDWQRLYDYPTWRSTTVCNLKNPIAIKPPKYNQSIDAELVTIRAYFDFLYKKGYTGRKAEFKKVIRESRKDTRRDHLSSTQYTQVRNTLRAWANSINATPSQSYNRKIIYYSILIMVNSCMRKGTLRNLEWRDLEVADNLTKQEQKTGHLIRIRQETNKRGKKRTIQSPTVEYFNRIRELSGIPKVPKSKFPHVPPEYLNKPIIKKHNKDERMGDGTWDREWINIKKLCKKYWGSKNITWYSFRHTGISLGVNNGIPLIQLSNFAGTSVREVELTYYHHEEESRRTWETFNKNRKFQERRKKQNPELASFDKLIEGIDIEDLEAS